MHTTTQAPRPSLSPASASLHGHDTVTLAQAMGLLAIVGDLAMGQPIDASARAACLAAHIALAAGGDATAAAHAHMVARLRWSGSTATATGFATLLGDDIDGRHAMLTRTLSAQQAARLDQIRHHLTPLAAIHCEVAGDIAAMLGLPAPVEHGPTPVSNPVRALIPVPMDGGTGGMSVFALHDISVGGIALLDSKLLLDTTVGRVIANCRIELPEIGPIATSLEIRNSLELTLLNHKTTRRIGCQFVDISRGALAGVQRYITKLERERNAKLAGLA